MLASIYLGSVTTYDSLSYNNTAPKITKYGDHIA